MNPTRFSRQVEDVLLRAGWSPTRRADISKWVRLLTQIGHFRIFPSAEIVLSEFGGINVYQHDAGIECARESFEINPLVAQGCESEFRRAEAVVTDKLFPLGEVVGGQAFLAIGESGSVYYFMETIGLVGHSFDEAVTRLIEGRLPLRVWDVDITVPPELDSH